MVDTSRINSKFENRLRNRKSQHLSSFALPDSTFNLYAILRETSGGTSYQMVRLVFRPYTQFARTICTSVSLEASIRISPDFTSLKYRSPPFGSKQLYSVNTDCITKLLLCCFRYADTIPTHPLAQVLNSSVRVSRRAVSHSTTISRIVTYYSKQQSFELPGRGTVSQKDSRLKCDALNTERI